MLTTSLAYPKDHVFTLRSTCVKHIVWCHLLESSIPIYVILWLVTITVTISSDVTDVWQHDLITPILILGSKKENINWKKKKRLNKKANIQTSYIWYYPPFKVPTSRETCWFILLLSPNYFLYFLIFSLLSHPISF